MNKLKNFDSSYFIGRSHFEEDGTQNYLVFQPLYKYFTFFTFNHKKVVNIYIVYELNKMADIGNNFPTLQNAIFGAVTLTKNADTDKHRYSGYGIGFDRRSSFLFPRGRFGQNALNFDGYEFFCSH